MKAGRQAGRQAGSGVGGWAASSYADKQAGGQDHLQCTKKESVWPDCHTSLHCHATSSISCPTILRDVPHARGLQEIDYTKEAANAERFKANFKDLDYVKVPTIYWEYTTPQVRERGGFEHAECMSLCGQFKSLQGAFGRIPIKEEGTAVRHKWSAAPQWREAPSERDNNI